MEFIAAPDHRDLDIALPDIQADVLGDGADVAPRHGLRDALEAAAGEDRPLRVKLGIDPTAPDLHLGHVVVLDRLHAFQQAGHQVVLIIGDFTARIGDPTGRSKTRPPLTAEDIERAAATFMAQAGNVIDTDAAEVVHNSAWLNMPADRLFELLGEVTVAQLIEREDFATRLRDGVPVSLIELCYPLMQAADSVAVVADVELGGTDQTFNLMLGRDLQQRRGLTPQVCLTLPLLRGTDGHQKMSKSAGNAIAITSEPEDMYGQVMSIPDTLMDEWLWLLLRTSRTEDRARDQKRLLARSLVARFHGEDAARAAEEAFDRVHRQRKPPENMPEVALPAKDTVHLPGLLHDAFGISRADARRQLQAGAVRLDGLRMEPGELDVPAGPLADKVLQLGKRRFVRLV